MTAVNQVANVRPSRRTESQLSRDGTRNAMFRHDGSVLDDQRKINMLRGLLIAAGRDLGKVPEHSLGDATVWRPGQSEKLLEGKGKREHSAGHHRRHTAH
jgi:hypothetical protein